MKSERNDPMTSNPHLVRGKTGVTSHSESLTVVVNTYARVGQYRQSLWGLYAQT